MDAPNQFTGSGEIMPQPYAYPYYTPTPPARPRRRWLIISLIAILLAGLLTVTGVLAFRGGSALKGNAGVVAACEYFKAYSEQSDKVMGSVQKQVNSGLGKEPFEIESSFDVSSDQFEQSGIPLRKVIIDIDAKYDLKDLGIKLEAMGVELANAYVIGDEFVLKVGKEAGSEKIGLPVKADLDSPMTLLERFYAFLPFLAEEKRGHYMRVLETFAQSVPDDYTDTYSKDIYSPVAKKELETLVTKTELDAKALSEVFSNFSDRLQKDDALRAEIQEYLDEFTDWFGLDEADLDDILEQLKDTDESDAEGSLFSWEVYQRSGKYAGLSLTLGRAGTGKITLVSEFSGDTFYSGYNYEFPDMMAMETSSLAKYNGNRVEIEAEAVINTKVMNQTMQQTQSVEFTKDGANTYLGEIDAVIDVTIELKDTYGDMAAPQNMTQAVNMAVTGDMEFKFGGDLDTLEESSDWNDIYDMEWGTLQDALEGFSGLSNALSGIFTAA